MSIENSDETFSATAYQKVRVTAQIALAALTDEERAQYGSGGMIDLVTIDGDPEAYWITLNGILLAAVERDWLLDDDDLEMPEACTDYLPAALLPDTIPENWFD
ncbi:hypothetical protein [Rhodococcus sp. T7]|uniref:hypothetical protein n=1 Tax=Rhodococcus sp. T7 TaxID=627444 RepID=UPI00135AEE1C|nr:hypothetical protein [Rhodococcus sp. T7]KAF0958464.1 hypothetical protein MLGJGCBP_08443 [Rhodococcus sp. T7]